MAKPDFWIKRTAGISAIGMPLVVMTSGTGGQHQRWGEYFIFVSGRNSAFYCQRTNADTRNVPERLIILDEAFMKQELEQQVDGKLSVHFFDLYDKTKNEAFLQRVVLEDGGPADIIGLWLRSEFHDEIKRVKAETQDDALRAFLSDVIALPPFGTD